jgi:hypothetical protein
VACTGFVENSTKREALIAENSDRGRAVPSLPTAASWFGGTVLLPGLAGGGGVGAAGRQSLIDPGHDAHRQLH